MTRRAIKILQQKLDDLHEERLKAQSPRGDANKIPGLQVEINMVMGRLTRLQKRLPLPIPPPELTRKLQRVRC
jgi:hypothetical protein